MAAKTLRELALSITAKFADFKKSTQEVANETAKMKKSAKTASDGFKGLGSRSARFYHGRHISHFNGSRFCADSKKR